MQDIRARGLIYRQGASPDAGFIHYGYRVQQFFLGLPLKNALKQGQHLQVAVTASPKQDDSWVCCMAQGEKLSKVEVCGDDYTVLLFCEFREVSIFRFMQADFRGMYRVMTVLIKPCGKLVRDGHVYEEVHANSMISSSANAAA